MRIISALLLLFILLIMFSSISFAQLGAMEKKPAISVTVDPTHLVGKNTNEELSLTFHITIPKGYDGYIKGKNIKPILFHQPYIKDTEKKQETSKDSMEDLGFGTEEDLGFESNEEKKSPTEIQQGVEIISIKPSKEGTFHKDEYIGEYWTISGTIDYQVVLKVIDSKKLVDGKIALEIDYQLCTESMCIDGPTAHIWIPFLEGSGNAATIVVGDKKKESSSVKGSSSENATQDSKETAGKPEKVFMCTDDKIDAEPIFKQAALAQGGLIDKFQMYLESSVKSSFSEGFFLLALLFCFLAGIISIAVPCVWPLIPMTLGVLGLGARANQTKGKSFFTALAYSFGILFVFLLLGVVAGLFGETMVGYIKDVAVLSTIMALVFILMVFFAFSMFGLYEIRTPDFLQRKKDQQATKSKSLGNVFMFGIFAGLVSSPCLTPIVAFIFGVSAANGVMGILLMAAYGIGFSIPWLLLGTFSGLVSRVPKSGRWMQFIQYGFGILMLVAGYLLLVMCLEPLQLQVYAPIVYAVVLLVGGFFMGAFRWKKDMYDALKVRSVFGSIMVLLGVAITVLSFVAILNQPTVKETGHDLSYFVELKSDSEYQNLLHRADSEHKPLMLYFWDDLCKNCKLLKSTVFINDSFVNTAKQNVISVMVKVSNHPKLREEYKISGVPQIIFIDHNENMLTKEMIGWQGSDGKIMVDGLIAIIGEIHKKLKAS